MNPPNLDQSSDEELARRAKAGSLDCFEELVRRYQVPLLRFLLRRSPNPRDAEDIVQESFLRAYQSLARYRDDWPFKTWIFTLSYRLAISAARKIRPATETSRMSMIADDDESPAHHAARQESSRKLWETARKILTEDQFTAIWLHYAESIPARQIGRVMGKSWVAVKTTLHRARRKLQSALQPDETSTYAPAMTATATRGPS